MMTHANSGSAERSEPSTIARVGSVAGSALDARIGAWLRQAKIKDSVGDQFWKEGNFEQALRFKTESLVLNRCARELRDTISSPNVKDEPRGQNNSKL